MPPLPDRWRKPEPAEDTALGAPFRTERGIWYPWRRPGQADAGRPPFATFYPRRWASPPDLAEWWLIDPVLICRGKEDPSVVLRVSDDVDGVIFEVRDDGGQVSRGPSADPYVWHLFQDRAFPLRGLLVLQHGQFWEFLPVRQRHADHPEDWTVDGERKAGESLMREASAQQERDLKEMMPLIRRLARGESEGAE